MRYKEVEDHDLGEAPIERGLRVRMGVMARFLNRRLNPRREKAWGFVLLTFPYGSRVGRCNYVSNGAQRPDVAVLLLEQAAAFLQDEGHGAKAERVNLVRQEFEAEHGKEPWRQAPLTQ